MMPAAATSTGRRVASFIRKISVRRQQSSQPRFYRRRHTVDDMPAPAQSTSVELKTIGGLETTFGSHSSGNERGKYDQQILSGASVVNDSEAQVESVKAISTIADIKTGVLANHASNTAGGVEQRTTGGMGAAQKEHKGPVTSKSYSSRVSVGMDGGEEEHSSPRGIRDKIQYAKRRTLHSIRTAVPRSVGRVPRIKGAFRKENETVMQQRIASPIVPPSETMQNEETSLSAAAAEAQRAEFDQQRMTNVEDGRQTTRESEEIEKLRRDLSESHHQISELQKRCEAQSRDLEHSNNFMNTADKSSDSDIIYALQRLNAEVQQNTTHIADYLSEDFEFGTSLTKEDDLAAQRASDYIGQVLAKSFETKTSEEIPMLLQVAFQAYLASALCQTASSWAFEPAHNAFIDGIYQRLRRVEAQAISGRWRSLARVHNVHNWATNPESLVKGIIAGFSDILLAAGCTATQSDIISKVTYKFEGKIALLVELAARLNKLFDEVISSDFEVFIVRPGEKFEGKRMEDPDGDQVEAQEGPVLCATHLGLMKRIPTGTLWEKGRKQKVIVLKAKVLLESFLNSEN